MSARAVMTLLISLSLVGGAGAALSADDGPAGRKADDDRRAVVDAAKQAEAETDPRPDVGAGSMKKLRTGSVSGIYLPPDRSTPQGVRLVGAGTRNKDRLPRQIPLAPDHVGLTEQAQPRLHWHSTGQADVRVDFALMNVDSGQIVLDTTLMDSISQGDHELHLADHDVSLTPGVTYRWFIMLVPDPENRAADIISAAGMRRVEAAGAAEDWAALAQRSIWYDAIAELSAGAASDAKLGAARAELLAAVGLERVGGRRD